MDVWAFGVLLWELYHGARAWAGLTHPQVLLPLAGRPGCVHMICPHVSLRMFLVLRSDPCAGAGHRPQQFCISEGSRLRCCAQHGHTGCVTPIATVVPEPEIEPFPHARLQIMHAVGIAGKKLAFDRSGVLSCSFLLFLQLLTVCRMSLPPKPHLRPAGVSEHDVIPFFPSFDRSEALPAHETYFALAEACLTSDPADRPSFEAMHLVRSSVYQISRSFWSL